MQLPDREALKRRLRENSLAGNLFLPGDNLKDELQALISLPKLEPQYPAREARPEPRFILEKRLRLLAAEKLRRNMNTLKMYRPMPTQEAFHKCDAPERIVVGSNRGSKTTAGVFELAWALTGTHPWLDYPKKDGIAYAVGKDGDHLSRVFYRKLFKAGSIKMIRDEVTGDWRTYFPPTDKHRKSEAKPAPPLIPRSLIDKIAWENKALEQPRMIRLKTGWELVLLPSGGNLPQGVDIDICVFDEEIEDRWYAEMSARLVDRNGKFFWLATPQVGNEKLLDLNERAEVLAAKGTERPSIVQFNLLIADNPYLDDDAKQLLGEKYSTNEEDYRVRILGEFAAHGYRMYPEFGKFKHGLSDDDAKSLFPENGDIPDNWSRYVVIDPGHTVCAAIFAAVPPPSWDGPEDQVFLFDELYLHQCTADKLAAQMRLKTQGHNFEAFVIDDKGSARSELGPGKTIISQYAEAFREHGVRSEATKNGFIRSSYDVLDGCMRVREWLSTRADGTQKLRYFRDKMPNFTFEIEHYRKKRDKALGVVRDEPDQRKNNHLMDALRYLAMYDPMYIKPRPLPKHKSPAVMAYESKRKRTKSKRGPGYVNLGPSARN